MTSANLTPTSPDEHLVRALVHDLDAGFIRLFEVYRDMVFSAALRICGRWADAEDLTAESFLRAYRALTEYRRCRILALRPKSWLLTITLNVWRNQWRDAARRPACAPLDETVHAEAAADPVPAELEPDGELGTLLATLPDNQRAAVVLRHVVDLPVAEIATILGRPEGTVKSDISRGLRRLRGLCPHPSAPPDRPTPAANHPTPPPRDLRQSQTPDHHTHSTRPPLHRPAPTAERPTPQTTRSSLIPRPVTSGRPVPPTTRSTPPSHQPLATPVTLASPIPMAPAHDPVPAPDLSGPNHRRINAPRPTNPSEARRVP